jgi:hypothetical protein
MSDATTDRDADSDAKRGSNSERNPDHGAPNQAAVVAVNADMRMTIAGQNRRRKAPDFGSVCPKRSRWPLEQANGHVAASAK